MRCIGAQKPNLHHVCTSQRNGLSPQLPQCPSVLLVHRPRCKQRFIQTILGVPPTL